MKDQTPAFVFNAETAASYDQKTGEWAASRDALFSMMRLILAEMPAESRILCVGVGTGTEMIALAQSFPNWHFTAVEPAPAMLSVCRRKAHDAGIDSRCTFHEGFLETLPASEPFDAATCLLVSHFFTKSEERTEFFAGIAERMRPQGILINSDLMLNMPDSKFQNLLEVWMRMLHGSGWSAQDTDKMRDSWNKSVSMLSSTEAESVITAGGFETPTLFFQTLFIHAWFSKRSSTK